MAHVLVVEPDSALAATYAEALRYGGHTVQLATSAQGAIHAADDRTPQLVLLELQLPAHNGIAFLYEFRSYPEWRAIPVIINSYTPPQTYRAVHETLASDLGVCDFLYKPRTTLQQLLRSVAHHISQEVA
jgi:CheY-like chemotaxis protein